MSMDSIVNIFVDGEIQASGVVVGRGRVITCLHVVDKLLMNERFDQLKPEENSWKLKIEIGHRGKMYPAVITRGNQHHDLCLLSAPSLSAPALSLAPAEYLPQEGDTVFSIGLPKGEIASGEGTITRLDQIKTGEPPLIQNSAPSRGGCSGGALLNEAQQLIGIQSLPGAALPHAWIHALFERRDRKIISRSENPETEVDYYFEALSQKHSIPPSSQTFIRWVLERPESEFAAKYFVPYHRDRSFTPEVVSHPDDYNKVLDILTVHHTENPRTKGLTGLAGIVPFDTPYREKYLILARSYAQNDEQRADLNYDLGNYYLNRRNYQKAKECYEKATEFTQVERVGQLIRLGIAFTELCHLYLAEGETKKAHQAFIGAFEARCREWKKDTFSYKNYPLAFKVLGSVDIHKMICYVSVKAGGFYGGKVCTSRRSVG